MVNDRIDVALAAGAELHVRELRKTGRQVLCVTLGIYYLLPFVRWDRGPNLPDQAVLIDMANRRFFFFMIEIWPHEFYFVAGLLIMAGLGLFLFTSAAGRVWCGYACPQTVYTEIFLWFEKVIEGERPQRIKLDDLADAFARLSDAEVETDEVEQLVVNLARANIISGTKALDLVGEYLEQKFHGT